MEPIEFFICICIDDKRFKMKIQWGTKTLVTSSIIIGIQILWSWRGICTPDNGCLAIALMLSRLHLMQKAPKRGIIDPYQAHKSNVLEQRQIAIVNQCRVSTQLFRQLCRYISKLLSPACWPMTFCNNRPELTQATAWRPKIETRTVTKTSPIMQCTKPA